MDISQEYYIYYYVISEEANKQDYFALGSILFFIKYDKDLLKCKKKTEDKLINAHQIIDLVQKKNGLYKISKISRLWLHWFFM